MRREANIPLFLWITTAVVVHLLWSRGADEGAKILSHRLDIQNFARTVQNHVRGIGTPVEVALLDDEKDQQKDVEKDDPDKPEAEKPPDPEDADKDDPAAKLKPPVKELVKPEEKKPAPPKPEEKKAEEKKPEEKKPEAKKAEVKPPPDPELAKKVAVKQVVDDDKQPDNPDAKFIADQANHVLQEQQARITSADQNDAKPTPGGEHSSPDKSPGDSDHSRVLQAEDKPGEKDNAPSETPASQPDKLAMMRPPSASDTAHQRNAPAREESGARAGSDQSQTHVAAEEGQKAQAASKASDPIPDAVSSENGHFTVPGPRQALVDQAAAKAHKYRELPKRRSAGQALLGFGSAGTTANGVNLNLMPRTAIAAIGTDQLARERLVDGERRRSAHLGSWHPTDPSRWRSAIENYVPSVKPGNQTALNTARSAFAGYLNAIHNRIHPLFADGFLSSLDRLPSSDPMNNEQLSTEVEIILDQESGNVVRMGVTKFSGITAFDIAALDSVKRAAPFGTPPREIVSPDGNVYLHWEFHRNTEACSTLNARPFMLNVPPKAAPSEIPAKPAPSDPSEAPPAEQRHGQLRPSHPGVVARN